jgi:sn-glycerol 3-phosphate transport system ATP-binding protein
MAKIAINTLNKIYSGRGATFHALRGINLDVADREFVVLLGPSGCGKSTLLRLIAGLDDISSGEIRIGDRRVNELPPAKRDIAMVFQDYALYPHMSVRDNLAFGLRVRRTNPAEMASRIADTAELLGLGELLDRKPAQLSGGQRQRVAIGRAIVRKPAVFLFDEPLSNLDAKLRIQMRMEIASLQRRLGVTTVYVTHDQVEAMTLAHRVVLLHRGEVQQVGSPLEVYHRPSNKFVAAFLGSPGMNLLPGRLFGHPALEPYTLGIRPEAVGVSHVATGANARVLGLEPLGYETQLILDYKGERLIARTREQGYQSGERVRLSFDKAALSVFEAKENGRRLELPAELRDNLSLSA